MHWQMGLWNIGFHVSLLDLQIKWRFHISKCWFWNPFLTSSLGLYAVLGKDQVLIVTGREGLECIYCRPHINLLWTNNIFFHLYSFLSAEQVHSREENMWRVCRNWTPKVKMEIRYHVVVPSPELAPPSAAKSSFTLNIWGIVIACVITAVGGAVLYFCIRRKIFPIFRQQWARKG